MRVTDCIQSCGSLISSPELTSERAFFFRFHCILYVRVIPTSCISCGTVWDVQYAIKKLTHCHEMSLISPIFDSDAMPFCKGCMHVACWWCIYFCSFSVVDGFPAFILLHCDWVILCISLFSILWNKARTTVLARLIMTVYCCAMSLTPFVTLHKYLNVFERFLCIFTPGQFRFVRGISGDERRRRCRATTQLQRVIYFVCPYWWYDMCGSSGCETEGIWGSKKSVLLNICLWMTTRISNVCSWVNKRKYIVQKLLLWCVQGWSSL